MQQIVTEPTPQELAMFQLFVLRWYQKHGRHELPWRLTADPYHILISELMLQQTQVERVIPKYQAFLRQFPNLKTLARAPLADVLALWQGLGYNRRARFVWLLAQTTQDSPLPTTLEELQKLPGIGPYTAAAIMAFAYNEPVFLIETNVRSVFLHHFFPKETAISDKKLEPLIQQAIPATNPREWYWALMDYGSYLKKVMPNPSRKSKTHTKQSTFSGSSRQVRGEIIRLLIQRGPLQKTTLEQLLTSNRAYFSQALTQLLSEKLVVADAEETIQLG